MSKYRAVPTVIDGVRFSSKKEARRYSELKLLQKGKQIADLKLQPRIECRIAGYGLVCTYVADFFYTKKPIAPYDKLGLGDICVYEDVKGMKTPVYRLKVKLVKALTGISILET